MKHPLLLLLMPLDQSFKQRKSHHIAPLLKTMKYVPHCVEPNVNIITGL